MINKLMLFSATGFGLGYLPFAKGTITTLIYALIYYYFINIGKAFDFALMAAITIWAVVSSQYAENHFNNKDDQRIVIDEIAGFSIAAAIVPHTFYAFVSIFLMFRLFDIIKPFPIRNLQFLKGGLGIVLDDAVAGLLSGLIYLLVRFFAR